jgi:hypothetical protein
MKREVIAAALSAVLPGTGQLFNRQWLKGTGFLVAVMIISGMVRRRDFFEGPSSQGLLVAAILLGIALWSVADAYLGAKASA